MEKVRTLHIILSIWVALALSAVAVHYADLIPAPTQPEIAELPEIPDIPELPEICEIQEDQETADTQELPEISSPGHAITEGLSAFLAALNEADSLPIRVVHYGDSQIEEDRITAVLRRHLQATYGGRGIGLIPLHQTIPTMSLRQELYILGSKQTPAGGPQRYLIYGPRSWRLPDSLTTYGPMGQVAVMDNTLVEGSEDLTLRLTPLKGATQHEYIRLIADSSITMTEDSAGLHLRGKGAVYGLSLEGKRGVYVDNIPMRGSLGTVFTGMNAQQLADYYRTTRTRLIILQYGGNFIAGTQSEQMIQIAVRGLRQQVRYLRRLAPEASFLFIGPSDMQINNGGKMVTHPLVPLMDHLLTEMAEQEHIAYYSLYTAMGGEGSMALWQEQGLASSDGVHFSKRGAEVMGEKIWTWIADTKEKEQVPTEEPEPIEEQVQP